MFARTAAAAFALAAASACSGGSPSATSTPNPAADALSRVAATAADAGYAATYTFVEAAGNQSATVQVWRNPPSLRVDVVAHGTTATLIVGNDASYSCSIHGTRRSCLLVAAAGQPLPAPFNVAPVSLFSVYVRQLATRTRDYDVTAAAPPTPSAAPLPASGRSTCFAVTPRAGAAQPQVPAGTYCFLATGVLTSAHYPSGNTITLQSAQATAPPASQFTPYAKPTPLPS